MKNSTPSPKGKKWKCGDVNPETGLVFVGYGASYANGEYWLTPEKFKERKERRRLSALRYYERSQKSVRAAVSKRERRQRLREGKPIRIACKLFTLPNGEDIIVAKDSVQALTSFLGEL